MREWVLSRGEVRRARPVPEQQQQHGGQTGRQLGSEDEVGKAACQYVIVHAGCTLLTSSLPEWVFLTWVTRDR